jgi:RNA polymerase sigma factor (sigma-70 family)
VPIRVVLVDDHPVVLQGLQALLDRQPDIDVVGACRDTHSALGVIRTARPDIVIVDLKMPGPSGLDLLRTLRDEQSGARAVLLTAAISEQDMIEAMRLGARGLVLKESPPESVVACVRRVYQGGKCVDQDAVARAVENQAEREAADRAIDAVLTPRETEIVRMVSQGLRNKAIADRLSISEGTVKVHLHNIYEKLGVDGRMELVLSAQQRRLL